METNRIIQGDCIEVMRTLPENSIDAIITDPPYNVLGKTQEWDKRDYVEFLSWTKEWMELGYDKCKTNSCLLMFWGQKYMKELFNLDTRWQFKRMLIWHHPNLAKPTRKMYLWTYDPIYYFVKGKPYFEANFTSSENVDVFRYAKPQSSWKKDYRFHPASKPVKLMEKLIKPNTQKDMVVLDPFVGGGATIVACRNLNRSWIGIEKNNEYYDVAQKRIEEYQNQSRLDVE